MTYADSLTFKDSDLRTPKHDEIMIWLDSHLRDVLAAVFAEPLRENEVLRTWEFAVFKPLKYGQTEPTDLVGHVDLLAEYSVDESISHGDFVFFGTCEGDNCKVKHSSPAQRLVAFEVKTTIPSLGDLIRQIRYYQGFLPSLHGFVVVSPDTRLRAQIESQRIGFYEY